MTRTGKIARLPRYLRDSLNQRLQEGEPGKKLVNWLNSLQVVQDVMEEYFNNAHISEQNLSEWKQGGYLEWQKHEESIAWARQITEQSEDLAEEAGPVPLSDRFSGLIALTLGKLLAQAAAKPLEDKAGQQQILTFSRELALLRREDHRAARLKMELEIHAREQAAADREEAAKVKERQKWGPLRELVGELGWESTFHNLTKHMPAEFVKEYRELITTEATGPPKFSSSGATDAGSHPPDPTKSNSIKPNQTG